MIEIIFKVSLLVLILFSILGVILTSDQLDHCADVFLNDKKEEYEPSYLELIVMLVIIVSLVTSLSSGFIYLSDVG